MKKMPIACCAAGLLLLPAALHAQQPAAPPVAQPTHVAPGRATFMVEIKVGNGLYVPMGASKVRDNIANVDRNADIRTLTIYMTNVSGKVLEGVKVDYAMYKLDQTGAVRQMGKGTDKSTFKQLEKKLITGEGRLNTYYNSNVIGARSEEFYGWYVKITVGGDTVYEKIQPTALKDTDEFKRNFPPPKK